MQKRMDDLEGFWEREFRLKRDLQIQINIHTGHCTVGNFGSEDRLDYTGVGASVNLTSSLEALAKLGKILVSEQTFLQEGVSFKFTKPREGEVRGFARKVKYSELITSDACGENILRLSGKEYELIKDKTNFDNDDLATLNL